MTAVDFTIHLVVADQEPGIPQTEESLREWLVPDLLSAIRSVIGYPGDYGAVYDPLPHPNAVSYSLTFPSAEAAS